MHRARTLACLMMATYFSATAASAEPTGKAVRCEGRYPKHLQGVCFDASGAIFWSFTDVLVKTDHDGNLLKQVDVANHHGDLCHRDGKVYVAVNLGEFNRPAGRADSWVYVYDGATLDELARHETPEVVHGAGGIAHHDGTFLVVGGLPEGTDENYLYEYDSSFRFRKRHILASGYTLMGIQTAAFADGNWWFGCYGRPQHLLKADPSFKLKGKWIFDASLGIAADAAGQIYVARGRCEKERGCTGELVPAVPDAQAGLRLQQTNGPERSR